MMRITLEPTTKIVELVVNGAAVPARVWEGKTDQGVPMHAYITRVAVAEDQDASAFERELLEQRKPTAEVAAIPARLIL